MKINSNISSFLAQNQLAKTSKAIARSIERMSSGLRVRSPKDDASAYVMGVRLEAQIRGTRQAIYNINTAVGMVATAEAAVSTQIEIAKRLRELALVAMNGILGTADRENLNQEVQQLFEEYNRISIDSEFDGRKLLDGSFAPMRIQVGTQAQESILISMPVTGSAGTFIQRITSGDGTFSTRVTYSTNGQAQMVEAADLNEDGILDLYTADNSTNTVSLLWGRGDGTFSAGGTLAVGAGVTAAYAKDVNNDGHLDIVSADNTANTISVLLGNGNGTFQTRTSFSSTAPLDVYLVDINADDKLDLITGNFSSHQVHVRLGNGNGTFGAATNFALTNPRIGTSKPISLNLFLNPRGWVSDFVEVGEPC